MLQRAHTLAAGCDLIHFWLRGVTLCEGPWLPCYYECYYECWHALMLVCVCTRVQLHTLVHIFPGELFAEERAARQVAPYTTHGLNMRVNQSTACECFIGAWLIAAAAGWLTGIVCFIHQASPAAL